MRQDQVLKQLFLEQNIPGTCTTYGDQTINMMENLTAAENPDSKLFFDSPPQTDPVYGVQPIPSIASPSFQFNLGR